MLKLATLPPDKCNACDWEPVIRNNDGQEIAIENQWLIVAVPQSVVWLFICPKCKAVWGNKNAVENVKLLVEKKKQKIIEPGRKPLNFVRGSNKFN